MTASALRVVLLANYRADGQPSMLRFADMLHDELAAQGVDVDTWHPPAIVGGRSLTGGAIHKWRGYVDKYALYPPRLSRTLGRRDRGATVVHVCDHSNAVYVPWLRDMPHVVTCHDLIAVRSALGEFPGERTRWTGRQLQQRILRGLQRSACIVCDSDATRRDVQRIVRPGDHSVIPPGLSRAFAPVPPDEARKRIGRLGVAASPQYVLHVGGSQWYKNRAGLLATYAALVDRMPDAPPLVLVGKPLSRHDLDGTAPRALRDRIVTVSGVDDADLAALYSSAALLLFPSWVEGFGWPVLEAVACGCRVVTSDRAPMTEVGGDVATYIDPENPAGAATAIEQVLREPETERRARVAAGLARAARFSSRAMADAYLSIYHDAVARRPHTA